MSMDIQPRGHKVQPPESVVQFLSVYIADTYFHDSYHKDVLAADHICFGHVFLNDSETPTTDISTLVYTGDKVLFWRNEHEYSITYV